MSISSIERWFDDVCKKLTPQLPLGEDYVDTGPSGLVLPLDMKFVPKRWGWESWIVNNDLYCGKVLFIKGGRWLSFHYHKVKDEVLYCQSGRLYFSHSDIQEYPNDRLQVCEMKPQDAFHVRPGLVHQMEAIEDTYLIEFSTKHVDEDSYRVTTNNVRNDMPDPERGY